MFHIFTIQQGPFLESLDLSFKYLFENSFNSTSKDLSFEYSTEVLFAHETTQ